MLKLFKSCFLVVAAVLIAFCGTVRVVPKAVDTTVAAVKETQNATLAPKAESINAARFLNMLNRNFVYGEDFNSAQTIVNNAVTALLDKADDEGYVNQLYVAEFLNNMYGAAFENLDEINGEEHYKEGFVYVIPRGFTSYEHTCADVVANVDGTFTVTTDVAITLHDSEPLSLTAITHFVKNENSIFGYSIISSEIVAGAAYA